MDRTTPGHQAGAVLQTACRNHRLYPWFIWSLRRHMAEGGGIEPLARRLLRFTKPLGKPILPPSVSTPSCSVPRVGPGGEVRGQRGCAERSPLSSSTSFPPRTGGRIERPTTSVATVFKTAWGADPGAVHDDGGWLRSRSPYLAVPPVFEAGPGTFPVNHPWRRAPLPTRTPVGADRLPSGGGSRPASLSVLVPDRGLEPRTFSF